MEEKKEKKSMFKLTIDSVSDDFEKKILGNVKLKTQQYKGLISKLLEIKKNISILSIHLKSLNLEKDKNNILHIKSLISGLDDIKKKIIFKISFIKDKEEYAITERNKIIQSINLKEVENDK